MGGKKSKKGQKKSKRRNAKRTISDNPFNDLSFWLTIATTDFSFGLFENVGEPKLETPIMSDIIFEKEE